MQKSFALAAVELDKLVAAAQAATCIVHPNSFQLEPLL
jgi:hypothetical protein